MTNTLTEIAINAAIKAGQLLIYNYKLPQNFSFKEDMSRVTKLDYQAENLIRGIIETKFPEHSIIGEELDEKKTSDDYLWIIDSLDGTTNYTVHNPLFAVSIGLVYKQKPLLGVVYHPFQDELFVAEAGKGSFLNKKRISIDYNSSLETMFISFCNGRDLLSRKKIIDIYSKLKLKNNVIRQIGAASLELCYTAAGRFGAFIMPGVNSWDVIAGCLIVQEAGGTVIDFQGNKFNLSSTDIIAGNPKIVKELFEIINS